MGQGDTHAAIQAVFRIEWARLVAGLVRVVRDVGLAEELAQDAIVAALEQWPASGIPENPGAWLQAVARNRAINVAKRGVLVARKHEQIGAVEAERERVPPAVEARIDDDVGDDMLRLVLIACDPVLPIEARVALTLRLLGGLTTDEIARAFLVPEPTIAQRIVRAKRTLGEAQSPFEVPRGADLEARLSSVFAVVYLIFNEGYAATAGQDLTRPQLCEDAMRLGRMLVALVPAEAEAHGLIALIELQQSRAASRTDAAGEPVLLLEQDRRCLQDALLIRRGLASLRWALALGGPGVRPYTLQAAIAACHSRAVTPGDTEWARIAEVYAVLDEVAPSAVVKLNRAMAVSMASGPAAGLALIDALSGEPALRRYHLLPSARADLLAKLGRREEAREEFERAAAMTDNAHVKSPSSRAGRGLAGRGQPLARAHSHGGGSARNAASLNGNATISLEGDINGSRRRPPVACFAFALRAARPGILADRRRSQPPLAPCGGRTNELPTYVYGDADGGLTSSTGSSGIGGSSGSPSSASGSGSGGSSSHGGSTSGVGSASSGIGSSGVGSSSGIASSSGFGSSSGTTSGVGSASSGIGGVVQRDDVRSAAHLLLHPGRPLPVRASRVHLPRRLFVFGLHVVLERRHLLVGWQQQQRNGVVLLRQLRLVQRHDRRRSPRGWHVLHEARAEVHLSRGL